MSTKRQTAVAKAVHALAPMMPLEEAQAVKALIARPHMRSLDAARAVWLATVTHVRHAHTDYDLLLSEGYDREAARFFVIDEINDVLRRWQATRFLDENEAIDIGAWPGRDPSQTG